MARPIDADELKNLAIETLENIKRNPQMTGEERHIICSMKMLSEMIDDAPTVDAQPVVHGRWEPEDNIFDDSTWICSACHEPWVLIEGTPHDNNMNFCPNCGAKMDGGKACD